MSEHADIIRRALGPNRVGYHEAHAALDALEAEIAGARREAEKAWSYEHKMLSRATAAEKEVRHYAALELAYVELQAENARLLKRLRYIALASGSEGDTA